MKLLLDTHLLLWAATGSAKLSDKANRLLCNEENELIFSAASIWEVAIKHMLYREEFSVAPRLLRTGLIDNGYQELVISSNHALGVTDLPNIHKDPFDRMLLAQSKAEGITLITSDKLLLTYEGLVQGV